MIDNKALSDKEKWWSALADFHSIPEYATEAEIIRNARRYLALRNAGVLIVGGLQMSEYAHGSALDAAADRLLENNHG